MKPFSQHLALALLLVGASLPAGAACSAQVGAPLSGSIEGAVIKGPVGEARVKAFATKKDGARGEQVAEAKTKSDGRFKLELGAHEGAVLVCAEEGTFTDEATGALVGLSENELCALVENHALGGTTKGVLVTPFTTLHAELSRCLSEEGRAEDQRDAAVRASILLNDFLSAGMGDFDLRSTEPLDVTRALAPSFSAEAWHGVLLAGLSESARQMSLASGLDPAVRVTAATLSTSLRSDIGSQGASFACQLDGIGKTGALLEGSVALSSDTLRAAPTGLPASILRFLDGERNASGISSASVSDLVERMTKHQSALFPADGGEADLEAPTLAFEVPAPDATVIGDVVEVSVLASDALSDVVSCSFTEPAVLGAGTSAVERDDDTGLMRCRLVATLNTGLLPDGDVSIAARATDAANNEGDVRRTIRVNNSVPVVSFGAPAPASLVSGTVTISVAANDPDGIAAITVEGAGALTDVLPAPGELQAQWDTTQSPEGAASLRAVAVDTTGNVSEVSISVVVDNFGPTTLSGHVALGAPLRFARIKALAFAGLTRGVELARGTTDEDGAFTLELVEDGYQGPVLLVASEGRITDVATGIELSPRQGQELVSAVAFASPGDAFEVEVNSWTTLAVSYASARSSEFPSDTLALVRAFDAIGGHLRRPETLAIDQVVTADLSRAAVTATADDAVLGLAEAGLSRLAANLSEELGQQAGSLTAFDVVSVLSRDISDGTLDGISPEALLFFDPGQLVAVTSYATRRDLAASIDNFLEEIPLASVVHPRNASGISTTGLSVPGGLYDNIANDAREDLYPVSEPPVPFDEEPPVLALGFGGVHEGSAFGDELSGVVVITGAASDALSPVASLVVLEPTSGFTDDAPSNEALSVSFGTDQLPNLDVAAAACGRSPARPELAALRRPVCVCAEATDGVGNSARELLCFERAVPQLSFASLQAGQVYNGNSFPVSLVATGSGGFDLLQCSFTVSRVTPSPAPAIRSETIDAQGSSACTMAVSFSDLSALQPDGEYRFTVRASDVAGNVSELARQFFVDTTAPSLVITTPAEGAYLPAGNITVRGTAANANSTPGVPPAVTLALRAGSAVLDTAAATFTSETQWTASFDLDGAVDGLRTIEVTAVDENGNSTTQVRTITRDTTPPLISYEPNLQPDVMDQGPSQPYERSRGCLQFPYSSCSLSPNGALASLVLSAQAAIAPTARRWRSLLATSGSAVPRALFSTDEPQTTLLFELSQTCTDPRREIASSGTQATVTLTSSQTAVPLGEQTGTNALCLSVRFKDRAGNLSARMDRFLKWQAVPPPVFVTKNGPYDPSDATNTADMGSYGENEMKTVLHAEAPLQAGYRVQHFYVRNTNSAAAALQFDTPEAPSLFIEKEEVIDFDTDQASQWHNGHPLVNPHYGNAETVCMGGDGGRLPCWERNGPSGEENRAYAIDPPLVSSTGAKQNHTDITGDCEFLGLGSACGIDEASMTNYALYFRGLPTKMGIDVTSSLQFFSVDTNGNPTTQKTLSNGSLSLQPGEVVIGFVRARHSFSDRYQSYDIGETIPEDDSPLFLRTMGGRAPEVTTTNKFIFKRFDRGFGLPIIKPRTFLWANNSSTNTCEASGNGANETNCHWGKRYFKFVGLRAEFQSSAKLHMKQTLNGTSFDWSASDVSLEGQARRITHSNRCDMQEPSTCTR